MQKYDAVIIGAGAAGLMCALRAGQRDRKVLLLDRVGQVGSKILIAGGGRCNFTNRTITPDRYLSDNPHFCLSALKSYTQNDFIALVEKHKIAYHEKTLGQLFCDNSAREIVDMLLAECRAANVEIRLEQEIVDVQKGELFQIQTRQDAIESSSLVLATGGLSIPKMGATDFSHQVAQRFGLAVKETRPALVPLVFGGETLDFMHELSGLSLEVVVTCGKRAFRENMIFTHRGLSGPAILQISSYWREGNSLSINLTPEADAETFLLDRKKERPKAGLKTILGEVLPQRLAQSLAEPFPASPIGELPNKIIKEVAALLSGWQVTPTGTEGYAKAEVTLGGVSTHELSSKTMEATKVPGLYVIGEAVDVTGWLGGYNFQWAWSSGWAAGSALGD
ncbi:MAG TPA: aminoacetone oxidase family FAD-binding enzyme [Rhodospirillaceae bacterium]|nr:aminoacetone oxidase family FAD-binding enzyme [Rhodospirillaceae bacterium]